jgi:hypothetical protein
LVLYPRYILKDVRVESTPLVTIQSWDFAISIVAASSQYLKDFLLYPRYILMSVRVESTPLVNPD